MVPVPVVEMSPGVVMLPDESVTPVAPVIAPAFVMAMEGVFRKLVNPVADAKLMPLIVLVPVLVAAGKLIPLSVDVLSVLLAFVKARLTPFTTTVPEVAEFVKLNAEILALFVDVE